MKNFEHISAEIDYWLEPVPDNPSEAWRMENDRDCVLTGTLFGDQLLNLWLSLRYTLDLCDTPEWQAWKANETKEQKLKHNREFLNALKAEPQKFVPDSALAAKLNRLFELGRTRCNCIINPYRMWNCDRGLRYYDYMPHFLWQQFNTPDKWFRLAVINWIVTQNLTMFFEPGKPICGTSIRDLAGTGAVWRHKPGQINVPLLISNYIDILERRSQCTNFGT